MLTACRSSLLRCRAAFTTVAPLQRASPLYDAADTAVQVALAEPSEAKWADARSSLEAAADDGDGRAMARLARWHVFGIGGVGEDVDKAWGLCVAAHDEDATAEAQYWLGRLALQGRRAEEPELPSEAPAPRPDTPLTEEESAALVEQGKAVLEELKAVRKQARRARKAKAAGVVAPALRQLPASGDANVGRHWLLLAAEQNHTAAQVALGNLELNDAQDEAAARQWYQLAIDTDDNPDAMYNLGTLLAGERPDEARSLFERAACHGDLSAKFWLGYAFCQGDASVGVSPDREKALQYLTEAADGGHSGAQDFLSTLYFEGHEALRIPPDAEKRQHYLQLAAEGGHPRALFDLGECYLKGLDGYSVDAAKALSLLSEAGEKGSPEAFVTLGAMHYHGIGVVKDPTIAFDLYQRAGELGSVEAWENVAAMYATGEGVPQSAESARLIAKHVASLKAGK